MVAGASGLYDRARPSYPQPALDKIVSLLPRNARVVELGAGTGLFTRGLLASGQGKIDELVAVEPSQGMRHSFNDKLRDTAGTKVECVDGLFDKIPVEDSSADAVSLDLPSELGAFCSKADQA